MEEYARKRLVLRSDSAAKQPQRREPIAAKVTTGTQTSLRGSSATVRKRSTKASTVALTGRMKSAVIGSGAPS